MATFLWNPSRSHDKVQLPALREVDDDKLIDSHCLLSDAPTAAGCVVILVEGWNDTFIWYCRPGGDHWEKYEYDIRSHVLRYPDGEVDQIEKDVIWCIAACGGKFYFADRALARLCAIDFVGSPEPKLTAASPLTTRLRPTAATTGMTCIVLAEYSSSGPAATSTWCACSCACPATAGTRSINAASIGWISRHIRGAMCVILAGGRSCCPGSTSERRALPPPASMGCCRTVSTSSLIGTRPCRCSTCEMGVINFKNSIELRKWWTKRFGCFQLINQ